jgi:uncharacterized membrane protein
MKSWRHRPSILDAVIFDVHREVLLGMISIYSVVFSILTVQRHRGYLTTAFDLGQYTQVIASGLSWTHFMSTNLLGFTGSASVSSFLAFHFEPGLIFFVPVYALFPSPDTLLVVQTILIALGAVPVYLLAEAAMGKGSALVFGFAYLFNPAIQWLNWFDFHPTALAPLLLASSFYFLSKHNYRLYFAVTILAMTLRDEISLAIIGLGVYIIWANKSSLARLIRHHGKPAQQLVVGCLTTFLGLAWIVLSVVVVQFFSGGHALSGQLRAYAPASGRLIDLIPALAYSFPSRISYDLVAKLTFIFQMLIPLALTPLLSIEVLLIPILVILVNFLSHTDSQYSIRFAYNISAVPFLLIAAVEGIRRISFKMIRLRRILLLGIVFTSILTSYSYGPVSTRGLGGVPSYTAHDAIIDRTLTLIPRNSSVSTQNDLFPHVVSYLSNPLNAYLGYHAGVDFILADTTTVWYWHMPAPIEALNVSIGHLLASHVFGVMLAIDGVILLKAHYVGPLIGLDDQGLDAGLSFKYNIEGHTLLKNENAQSTSIGRCCCINSRNYGESFNTTIQIPDLTRYHSNAN